MDETLAFLSFLCHLKMYGGKMNAYHLPASGHLKCIIFHAEQRNIRTIPRDKAGN